VRRIGSKIVATVCFVSFLGTGGSVAFAEKGYYKWADERGNPQHSDRPPPPGTAYEFVSTDTGMRRKVDADTSGDATSSAPSLPAVARPSTTEAEKQAAVEKDSALCDRARANLDTLNSRARVRIRDKDEIRYLTDEEKDIQRRKAQDLIDIHC
jgi:hypothetical protein